MGTITLSARDNPTAFLLNEIKLADIQQMTFSNTFSYIHITVLSFKFHWNLLPKACISSNFDLALIRQQAITWWSHQMEAFSALLAICAGEFTGDQRPVTQSFDVFFDLRPNKRMSKQMVRLVIWDAIEPIMTSLIWTSEGLLYWYMPCGFDKLIVNLWSLVTTL